MTAPSRVAVAGELTIQTAAEQKAVLLGLLDAGDDLELVLAEITELDTAGLQLLLLTRREATRAGKSLRFTEPSRAVADALAIARLTLELDAFAAGFAGVDQESEL